MSSTEIAASAEPVGGCSPNPAPFPQETPAAMAYIPFQQFEKLYPPEKALSQGTVFPELDNPFLGGGAAQ